MTPAMASTGPRCTLTLASLLAAVCRERSLTVGIIRGPSRAEPAVRARRVFAVLAHREGFASDEIGKALNKDRTTIVHAIQKWRDSPPPDVHRIVERWRNGETLDVHELVATRQPVSGGIDVACRLNGRTADALRAEADRRRVTVDDLIAELIETVAVDGLVGAVLDR